MGFPHRKLSRNTSQFVKCASEWPKDLVENVVSQSVNLKWDLKFWISNKLTANASAAGPGITFGGARLWLSIRMTILCVLGLARSPTSPEQHSLVIYSVSSLNLAWQIMVKDRVTTLGPKSFGLATFITLKKNIYSFWKTAFESGGGWAGREEGRES